MLVKKSNHLLEELAVRLVNRLLEIGMVAAHLWHFHGGADHSSEWDLAWQRRPPAAVAQRDGDVELVAQLHAELAENIQRVVQLVLAKSIARNQGNAKLDSQPDKALARLPIRDVLARF